MIRIVKETIEAIMTKEQQLIEFEQLTKPLIEHIRNFYTPDTKIIIDWNDAIVVNDDTGWNYDKALSDLINRL